MSKRRTVVILTGNHICHNPRAFKEAEALTEAGLDVEWLGGWFHHELAERDMELMRSRKWRFTPVTVWTRDSKASKLQKIWQRARRWAGLQRFRLLGWESEAQIGYCTRELLTAARARRADLYIAHSEPALWAAEQLRRKGFRVGIDMEDWFSEDLLPEARRDRPLNLLRSIEGTLLRSARHRTCTSSAMSDALSRAYQCEPPLVIYNAFPLSERKAFDGQIKDRRNRSIPSLHWFSQTIAPGRGLEDLFEALPLIKVDVEIHLRGHLWSENYNWLERILPPKWRDRIFTHQVVRNSDLLPRIAEHDIGLALEPTTPPNKELTVSNKILQYLLGGLAVVASDTGGQREVAVRCPEGVILYPSSQPNELARQLNILLSNPSLLHQAKAASLRAAEEIFCWERMMPLLVESVERSLSSH